MKKISRRNFLNESIFLAGSVFFFSEIETSSERMGRNGQEKKKEYPSYLGLEKAGLLSQRADQLYSFYENCHLCPRDCRVNRLKGEIGRCQSSSRVKVSSAFPHFGEEAPLVGKMGSGTVFFSNCGLRCVYCQNYTISIQGEGTEISDQQLAEIMIKLQNLGCHNINLVTPTHYLPNIVSALRHACRLGLHIPLVYNTGGYEVIEALELLDGIIDIYMPDCKYMDSASAGKYSEEAYNYPHYAKKALKEMFRQVGDLELDEKGIAVRGLIIRHLILPNRIAGSEKFLKFVAEELSKTTYLNLMRQYRPEHKALQYPAIARRLNTREYEEVLAWAKKYGLSRLDK